MVGGAQILFNPVVDVAVRTALGGYVIFMARKFYADPTGYFRRSAHGLPDVPWLPHVIRALALFCIWGGCFIIETAVSVQILGLHGDLLAVGLVMVALAAAWMLLPKPRMAGAANDSGVKE
jgi:hypothetical protein